MIHLAVARIAIRWWKPLLAVVMAAPVGLLCLLMLLVAGTATPTGTTAAAAECNPTGGQAQTVGAGAAGLTLEQTGNAATIISVGKAAGIPPQGWVVALAAAMQESTLRNLDYGDRDSLGLFQQRPSTGWGTPARITDPVLSAQAFYGVAAHTANPGLTDVAGWEQMPTTVAAQRVQRSAFPDAYARWEPTARQLVAELDGTVTVAPVACEAPAPAPTGPWTSPLAPGSYRLTSGFLGGFRATGGHSGMDWAAPIGTPIMAASAGTVTRAGLGGAYGNLVVVDHGNGVTTWYAHLSRFATSEGATTLAGTVIGYVGNTGNTTGPHLHLEVRVNDEPTDPEPYLIERGVNP